MGWVRLGVGDDIPETLLSVLVAALTDLADLDIGTFPLRATSAERFSTEVAPAFGRAIRRCRRPFVLVIDDFHVVANQASVDLVVSLAQNVPSGSTLVLVSRSGPGAAFARARVHPGMIEIGSGELSLDRAGVAAVLRSIGVVDVDGLVDPVLDETEGWPAGVRLLGFELAATGSDLRHREWAGAGPERSVTDYVDSEWLRGLGPFERDFLMRCSGLDRMSGALCDFVLERVDSGQMLSSLHTNRLTVLPLDRQGKSYRMHRVLSQVLFARFDQVDSRSRRLVDRRASEWFERVGDIDRAIRHAVRADDLDRALQLIADHAVALQTVGRHGIVAEWIGLLPRSPVVTRSDLCLASAVCALGSGRGDESMVWTQMARAAARLETPHCDESIANLRAAAFNALIGSGPITELMPDARLAYDRLPAGHWRAVACEAYGALAFAVGEIDSARRLFIEGAAEAAVSGARTDELHCCAHLSIALEELGDVCGSRESRPEVPSNHVGERSPRGSDADSRHRSQRARRPRTPMSSSPSRRFA